MANGTPGRPKGVRYKGDWYKDRKPVKPLDERQLAYVDWLLDPRPANSGGKGYAKDFAASIGVVPNQLPAWRSQQRFKDELDRRVKELPFDAVKIAHVVQVMVDKAMDGDNKAIEMFLKYAGQFQPARVEVTTKGAKEMSDAELAAALAAAADEATGAVNNEDQDDDVTTVDLGSPSVVAEPSATWGPFRVVGQ